MNEEGLEEVIPSDGSSEMSLPPQESPDDLSNWVDKDLTAPDGKVHISSEDGDVD